MKKNNSITVIIIFWLFCAIASAQEPVIMAGSDWPPFEYQENGVNKGCDVEIITAAFKAMDTPLEIKFFPWKRCEYMAKYMKVDGLFTMRKTPEREAFAYFSSEPINFSENVFFYKTGKSYQFNGKLEDLKGLTIGVTSGYNYGDNFMSSKLFNIYSVSNDTSGLTMVAAGRIDLFICDKLVGAYLLQKIGLKEQVRFLPVYYSLFEMYAGFSKKQGHDQLSARFDEAMKTIKAQGIYQQIIDKYMGLPRGPDPK